MVFDKDRWSEKIVFCFRQKQVLGAQNTCSLTAPNYLALYCIQVAKHDSSAHDLVIQLLFRTAVQLVEEHKFHEKNTLVHDAP